MKTLAAVLVLMSLSMTVHASGTDEDMAEIAAHEKAMKESDAKFEAKQAENRRQMDAMQKQQVTQMAAAVRPVLGAAAIGKSDAEVVRMYEEMVEREDANSANNDNTTQENDNVMPKGMPGFSAQDVENMSDQDIDKLEQQTFDKYKH